MKRLFIAVAAALVMLSSCGGAKDDSSSDKAAGQASLAKIAGINCSETTVNKKEGKTVLVVSASPRKGGNTDLLADEFAKGATEAGGKVEKVFLADYNLEFLSEQGANQPKDAPHNTDTWRLVEKFLNADVVALASPTYYMNVNDRMKTFIDATFLASGDERMGGKEFYYMTACAQADDNTAEWCFNGFRGFVMCLPNPTERGYVRAIGMGIPGAVKGSEFMKQAYDLGKGINK